jgi:hypothetical protein
VGPAAGRPRFEILQGRLWIDGRLSAIPKGLLYVLLARAGWKGEEGPVSLEMILRLRALDPRFRFLYLPPQADAAA